MPDEFDHESLPQVDTLFKMLGSMDACERLGFATKDENGVWGLTAPGLGYLLYLASMGSEGSPEAAQAFAAGFDCASKDAN